MAQISVADVMSLPAMRGAQVLAGHHGLNRAVRSVNIMEVPDVEAFVRSGDLLLTTAYPIHHDPSILNSLVKFFHERGLAALAIKRGRYLDELPAGLVDICDELAFPLISLRNDQSFDEVLGEVMSVVLADYGAEPSRADAIRERLIAVALSGGGFAEIAKTLAESIEAVVTIVDVNGQSITQAGFIPDSDAETEESFTIKMAGSTLGSMQVVSASSLTLAQRRLIQQACFAIGLYVAQTQAVAEVNRRLRTLALEELVRGTDSNRAHSALLYDWELDQLQQIAVAGPVGRECVTDSSRFWGRSALSWQRKDLIIVIFAPTQIDQVHSVAHQWYAALSQECHDVVVGVGERVEDTHDLVLAHATALDAWRIARRTQKRVAQYDDLQMDLLLESLNPDDSERFIHRQLGPLIEYDSHHDGRLVETLREVLGASNRVDASKRLFIHYNTLKYRLDQIRYLVGDDWDTPTRKTELLLALELHRLRRD